MEKSKTEKEINTELKNPEIIATDHHPYFINYTDEQKFYNHVHELLFYVEMEEDKIISTNYSTTVLDGKIHYSFLMIVKLKEPRKQKNQ